MIGQIGYLVKVSFSVGIQTALLYTFGCMSGAALTGVVIGGMGMGIRWVFHLQTQDDTFLLLVASLAIVGGLRDLGFFRLRLPQPFKQVPRGWLEVFGPRLTGLLWGFSVGLGFNTMIHYALYYVVVAWILLSGNPLLGAQALAIYGLAQGLLLTIEVFALRKENTYVDGLLGIYRNRFFEQLGGTTLITSAVFLFKQ